MFTKCEYDTTLTLVVLLFFIVAMHINCHHIVACICASTVQSTGGGDVTYFISTIAGTGDGDLKVNVPALEATFGVIFGITQSTNGDLYVTANVNHVVLKLEFDKQEGTWFNVTIIAGTGTEGTGADDVLGTESALKLPTGISLIENSNGEVTAVLINEYNNHRIRKLDMSTRKITTIAGTGSFGFSGDGSPAKDAQLWFPRHVYYDKSTDDIYIADMTNNRIRRVRDGTISTVVGKTCTGSEGLGDGGQATGACLQSPNQLIMNDAREWLIADRDNQLIRKVDSTGIITTVAGGGTETDDAPATSVQLNKPQSIAFTLYGELLVADYGESVIRKMDQSGFMKTIAGGGSETPSSDNPIPAKTAFIEPTVVAYARDGSDAIFIGDDSGYIFKLTSKRMCYGVWSDNSAVCSGRGSCVATDQCQCNDGWMGLDCSITHCFGVTSILPDRVCSGKGQCVRPNKCHCDQGFRGHKCHKQIKKP